MNRGEVAQARPGARAFAATPAELRRDALVPPLRPAVRANRLRVLVCAADFQDNFGHWATMTWGSLRSPVRHPELHGCGRRLSILQHRFYLHLSLMATAYACPCSF